MPPAATAVNPVPAGVCDTWPIIYPQLTIEPLARSARL